jgi:hypothetical protein
MRRSTLPAFLVSRCGFSLIIGIDVPAALRALADETPRWAGFMTQEAGCGLCGNPFF